MEGNSQSMVYKECRRNHSASLGILARDGCGEFMANNTIAGGLSCAACGCHRSFHRPVLLKKNKDAIAEGDAVHGGEGSGSNLRAPVQLRLMEANHAQPEPVESATPGSNKKKTTVYTSEQKEKMRAIAESLGWKMPKSDREAEFQEFLEETGIPRANFRIWMNNHKKRHLAALASASSPK